MKIALLILMASAIVVFLLALSSCGDDDEPQKWEDAVITGYDMRKCMCCGGWIIEIKDSTFRFFEFPEGDKDKFNLPSFNDNQSNYPINVRVIWKHSPEKCLGDEIIVERIEKR